MGFLRAFVASLALALIAGGALAQGQSPAPLDPGQVRQFEQVIRDYLIRNPEVLLDAMKALEQKQKQAAVERNRERIAANRKALDKDPDSFVAGDPKGDVTIVEFFDYRCPYCKRAHPTLKEVMRKDPKVRVVLKELPILGPDSVTASRAAIAVLRGQRAKYYAFHDAMLDAKGQLSEAAVMQIAADLGIDVERMRKDMADPKVEQVIQANLALSEALGITGTPAFVIGDELVPGAIIERQFVALIEQARTGCRTC
jgi:protein-disulfide isomerase